MQADTLVHTNDIIQSPENKQVQTIINYSELLTEYKFDFIRADQFLEVGEITWVQGWILDISVVQSQITELLRVILPVLAEEKTPFKLARNVKLAASILSGDMGYALLGKVISLYPPSASQAHHLAIRLNSLTAHFKGPAILTDRKLGNILYTRYGACNPVKIVNEKNVSEKYIYDSNNQLIKEPLTIPFVLPEGIEWPFGDIVPAKIPKKETVLQDRYKPISFLKQDVKGNVKKGLWLEKIYKIRWCVIKEGKECMLSDPGGTDIGDRLHWQFKLQKDLEGHIPLPKAYAFFKENGNSYLVMEFIRGISLQAATYNISKNIAWMDQPLHDRIRLLAYGEQVLDLIDNLHKRGYIHRDIAPSNFLVTRQHQLCLIDLELAYSTKLEYPNPPFRLGTPGFMSPEQNTPIWAPMTTPEIGQDIYGIGCTLIFILTGLFPGGFATEDKDSLSSQLQFFLQDYQFTGILTDCLSSDPAQRPAIAQIRNAISQYRNLQLSVKTNHNYQTIVDRQAKANIENAVSAGLITLASPVFTKKNKLWFSISREEGSSELDTTSYTDLCYGVSGVLYLLAKAEKAGFSTVSCANEIEANIDFIAEGLSNPPNILPGGLYLGTAGTALSLAHVLDAGITKRKDYTEQIVHNYLQNNTLIGNGIVKGAAGRLLALLGITHLLPDKLPISSVHEATEVLLRSQLPDGSWLSLTDTNKKQIKLLGFTHGAAGICCALLLSPKYLQNPEVEKAASNALNWLFPRQKPDKLLPDLQKMVGLANYSSADGLAGIGLCAIKAFEVIGDPFYQQIAEEILNAIPPHYVSEDLTLLTGVAGLGEFFIEGYRVFNTENWNNRANWIARSLLHYCVKGSDNSCYWQSNSLNIPTAGLMAGNSGVLHFLLRYNDPEKLPHPLLTI